MSAPAAAAVAAPRRRRPRALSESSREHAIWNASAGATKIRLRIELAAKARNPAATRAGITARGLGALHHVQAATPAAASWYPIAGSEWETGSHSVEASFSAELR